MGVPQPHRRADLPGQRAAHAPPVLKRAGLPRVRFHDLRHTYATLALQNGVDVKTVSGMLGHFSAGFTLDTYVHVTTASQRQAARTMGSILSGRLQT
ncbi:tyrosine-type recombinase/integrase [Flavonifractor plautii]|nr:tyrosine-type recombinase/integrase [Flavonifractor plautii]